jgi:hypothetical protein
MAPCFLRDTPPGEIGIARKKIITYNQVQNKRQMRSG